MSRITSYAGAAAPKVNHNVFTTRYKSFPRVLSDITEESSVQSQASDDEQDTPSSHVLSLFEDDSDNISSSSEPLDDVADCSMGSEATVIAPTRAPLNPNPPAFPPGLSVPCFIPEDLLSDEEDKPAPRRRKLLGESGHAPEWLRTFLDGSRCDAASYRDLILHSQRVCCHPSFNVDSDLSALAHKFTVQASLLKLAPGPDSLAPFTVETYRTVRAIYGVEAAKSFRAQLETICDQYVPVRWANEIIDCSQAEAQKAVAAVISMGGYIGELYVHGLLSGEQLNACMLRLLEDRPHSVEHIEAVHRMIMRSRGGYWIPRGFTKPCRPMIADFLTIFAEMTRSVTHDMSLTDTAYAPSVVKLWVDEVRQLLHDQMLVAAP